MPDVILVACPDCGRNNNMQRITCIYCGFLMPVAEGQELEKLPSLRPMEDTEVGFNLVIFPAENPPDERGLQEIQIVSRMTSEQVEDLLSAKLPMPLIRTTNEPDANLFHQRLLSAGVRNVIIADEDLWIHIPPCRVRRILSVPDQEHAIEVWSSELTPSKCLSWEAIQLIVFGRVRYKQIQVSEANNLYGRGREVKDVAEHYTEEAIIDFFGHDPRQHFRIRAESFDYTCLGTRMKLLALDNFQELSTWLTEKAGQAVINREFHQLTRRLEAVWPLSKTTERLPLKRIGVGKFAHEAMVLVDNELQFTRYGRMHYLLNQRKSLSPKSEARSPESEIS